MVVEVVLVIVLVLIKATLVLIETVRYQIILVIQILFFQHIFLWKGMLIKTLQLSVSYRWPTDFEFQSWSCLSWEIWVWGENTSWMEHQYITEPHIYTHLHFRATQGNYLNMPPIGMFLWGERNPTNMKEIHGENIHNSTQTVTQV